MSRKKRLTKEQEETRLRGLRILARMIARRHLTVIRGAGGKTHGPEHGNLEGMSGRAASGFTEEDPVFDAGQPLPPLEDGND